MGESGLGQGVSRHLEKVEPLPAAGGLRLPLPLSSSYSMETHMERRSPVQTCRWVQAPHPPGLGFLKGCTQRFPGVLNDTTSTAREVHGYQGVIQDTPLGM